MRGWLLVAITAVLGCGQAISVEPPSTTKPVAEEDVAAPPKTSAAPHAKDSLQSLWTRTKGEDWPLFLGPTGDSKSTEQGILTKWPAAGPKIVWQRKLGEGYGIGSVAAGRYYQADRVGDVAQLVCLNAETGEQLWKHQYPTDYRDIIGYDGGPRCSPIIDGNRVYMFGAEGMLHCYNATTGDVLWKIDTTKDFGVIQNFFGVGATPVIEGDLLITMIGGSPADSLDVGLPRAEPNGTAILALNKHTGKVVYKVGDDLASYATPKLTTIDGRRWCFAFCRAGLLAFEPTKGKLDFHYPWRAKILESVNASVPVVVDNRVFISETYGPGSALLSVIPGDYKVVWADDPRVRDKAMQTHWNTPIHLDGYVYGSSGRHTENAELRCIELKTGKVTWSEPGLTRTSLMYVDGHLLSLGEYGQLLLIKVNPQKYELVAETTLSDDAASPLLKHPAWAAPVLSHGLLYVRGADRVVCLELIP
jgi:outer membrane protein assembly factor BamB